MRPRLMPALGADSPTPRRVSASTRSTAPGRSRCLQAKRWTIEYVRLGWPRYPRPASGCRAVNFEPIHARRGLTTMRKEHSGIPGTTVFDGEQSRRGYHLNQFCMSLLNPANRDRFKAGEEAYLSEWNLTQTQKSAVLRRDYNAMIAEGGNIYFIGKIGATDGKSFVQLAASMTSMTPESYTKMMVRGGRAPGAALTTPQPTNPAEGGL